MVIPLVPAVVAVSGTLIYALADNGKAVEIGRALMWTGLLVLLLVLAGWKAIAV